ncbi:Uncharacterised protein [Serratia quinivorans]|nr:Uncharacterised protein [Serratia quinivorans]CAI1531971.1 Uncharacterised protein [Serratia quinivorans]
MLKRDSKNGFIPFNELKCSLAQPEIFDVSAKGNSRLFFENSLHMPGRKSRMFCNDGDCDGSFLLLRYPFEQIVDDVLMIIMY